MLTVRSASNTWLKLRLAVALSVTPLALPVAVTCFCPEAVEPNLRLAPMVSFPPAAIAAPL